MCEICSLTFSDEEGKQPLYNITVPANGHVFQTVNGYDATCTEDGMYTHLHCSVCGNDYWNETDKDPALPEDLVIRSDGHSLSFNDYLAPTCTEDGHSEYFECSVCHKYFLDADADIEITDKDSVILPGGHKLTYHAPTPATCTQGGNIGYYECTVCWKFFSDAEGKNEIIDKSSVIIPASHDMTYHESSPATCTEDGNFEYYECSVCHKYFWDKGGVSEIYDKGSVIIPAYHDLIYHSEVPATCTEGGNIEYYECSVCHKYFSDADGKNEITDKGSVILPPAHKMSYCAPSEPTCYSPGNIGYYECYVCHKCFSDPDGKQEITDKDSVIIPARHTLTYHAPKDATCTEDGNTGYYECTVCYRCFSDAEGKNDISASSVILPAHNSFTRHAAVEPTCEHDGNIEYYECSVCHKYFSDAEGKNEITDKGSVILRMLPHSLEHVDAKAATCTQNGNIEYWKCTACGGKFYDADGKNEIPSDGEILTASGHSYSDAWSSDDSEHWHACIKCGDRKDVEQHTWNGEPLAVCTVCGYELGYSSGLIFSLDTDGTGYSVRAAEGLMLTEVIIPSVYKGLPVVSIESYAFRNCTSIVTVQIPDSVTRIDTGAFEGCTSLSEITISEYITSLSNSIFYNCTSLETVYWNANGYSLGSFSADLFSTCTSLKTAVFGDTVEYITPKLFEGCASLESVTFGSSLKGIGYSAFYGCTSIRDLLLPDGLTSIETNAFADCRIENIVIPDSIQEITSSAFYNCNTIKTAKLPCIAISAISKGNMISVIITSGTEIPSHGFSDAGKLVSIVIPDTVDTIGTYAFKNCSSLESIQIPDAVTVIPMYAFYGCSSLESITLSDNVHTIAKAAFENCSALSRIEIGDSLSDIDYDSFYGCNAVTYVKCPAIALPCISNDSLETIIVTSGGRIEDHAFSNSPYLTTVSLADSVTYIGIHAFSDCPLLTSVELGNNVSFLSESAFTNSDSIVYNQYGNAYYLGNSENPYCVLVKAVSDDITTVAIHPDTVTLAEKAFYSCKSISEFTVPDSVKYINGFMFNNSSLLYVTIGSGVTQIDQRAFSYCGSLESITVSPDNTAFCDVNGVLFSKDMTKLLCFPRGNHLTSYVIPYGVVEISDNAFYYSTELVSLTIPESTVRIGSNAFISCIALKELIGFEHIRYIGESAFAFCNSLTDVTIGNDIEFIGRYAFRDTAIIYNEYDNAYYLGNADNPYLVLVKAISGDITSCLIHPDTKVIAGDAFSLCSKITEITIPAGVTSIGDWAFSGCSSLVSVEIPEGVSCLMENVFADCTSLESVVIPASVDTIDSLAFYGSDKISTVFYKGTAEEWDGIVIEDGDTHNAYLKNAARYYYVENSADVPGDGGNYWHYDTDGSTPVIWN